MFKRRLYREHPYLREHPSLLVNREKAVAVGWAAKPAIDRFLPINKALKEKVAKSADGRTLDIAERDSMDLAIAHTRASLDLKALENKASRLYDLPDERRKIAQWGSRLRYLAYVAGGGEFVARSLPEAVLIGGAGLLALACASTIDRLVINDDAQINNLRYEIQTRAQELEGQASPEHL